MSFTLGGDLDGVMTALDSCLQAMSVQPDIHMLRVLLETQLRKCVALRAFVYEYRWILVRFAQERVQVPL